MKLLLTHQQAERLFFRELEPGDFKEWPELFNDQNTTKMLGIGHLKYLLSSAKNSLNGHFTGMTTTYLNITY